MTPHDRQDLTIVCPATTTARRCDSMCVDVLASSYRLNEISDAAHLVFAAAACVSVDMGSHQQMAQTAVQTDSFVLLDRDVTSTARPLTLEPH